MTAAIAAVVEMTVTANPPAIAATTAMLESAAVDVAVSSRPADANRPVDANRSAAVYANRSADVATEQAGKIIAAGSSF